MTESAVEHPAGDEPASPLCPACYPQARYVGEVVDGLYLAQLTQPQVRAADGAIVDNVAGRYALFREDAGCSQLVALLPAAPAPCPIDARTDAAIDAAYERVDAGELDDLPEELVGPSSRYGDWLREVEQGQLLLRPDIGYGIVHAACQLGYEPEGDGRLRPVEAWLYDRAGALLAAADR